MLSAKFLVCYSPMLALVVDELITGVNLPSLYFVDLSNFLVMFNSASNFVGYLHWHQMVHTHTPLYSTNVLCNNVRQHPSATVIGDGRPQQHHRFNRDLRTTASAFFNRDKLQLLNNVSCARSNDPVSETRTNRSLQLLSISSMQLRSSSKNPQTVSTSECRSSHGKLPLHAHLCATLRPGAG